MSGWGRWVARHARAVLFAWAVLFVGAAAYGSSAISHLVLPDSAPAASDSMRGYQFLQQRAPQLLVDVIVVYSSPTLTVDDPAFRDAVRATVATWPRDTIPHVRVWYDDPDPALVSADRHATRLYLTLVQGDIDNMTRTYRQVKDRFDAPAIRAAGLQTGVSGSWAMADDVFAQTEADATRAELIALPIVLVLSLWIFGTVPAALLPVALGVVAVVGSLAALRALTLVTTVSLQATNIVTLLGMGLAVDYCLFLVSRFREELGAARGAEVVAEALAATMATAGRTVAFSGLIVAVSMSSLVIFPMGQLSSMAYGGVAAVLLAMIAALSLLPALLAVLGHRVNALAVPFSPRRDPARLRHQGEGPWGRLAHHVMRRPWRYLLGSAALLLATATPFLHVQWGAVDVRALPADAPSRVAEEAHSRLFWGGERSYAIIPIEGATPQAAASYAKAVAAVPGVETVAPLAADTGRSPYVVLLATWPGQGQSVASQERVRELRAVAAPEGTRAYVSGDTAFTVDQLDATAERLPLMAAIVVGAMLVLLFFAFRSVVLPIKAVLVAGLSITSSFGLVTWVFQDGHLAGLLGFTPNGYLEASVPVMMVAVLFGLSMDYEVFLLSRVREEWQATGDNTTAVASGVARTGGIITGAAVLLAVVVGAFITSGVIFVKMLGLGMLLALLLDATVVRGILVPAAMRLLGNANWWLPGRASTPVSGRRTPPDAPR